MSIEIKITGETPEEVIKQINGLVAGGGAITVQSQLPKDPPPKTEQRVVPPVADADDTEEEETDDGSARPEVDAEGLPFDERIHSKAKEPFKADGTWKRRKGITEDERNTVRAELIAKRDAGKSATTVTEQVTSTANQTLDAAPVAQVSDTAPAPQPEQSAPAPAPSPAAPASGPATPEVLRQQIQGAIPKLLAGLKTPENPQAGVTAMKALLNDYGVLGIPQIPEAKLGEALDRIQRMTSDPANAETIASGLM